MTGQSVLPEPTQSSGPRSKARRVSARTAARLAWSVWLLALALLASRWLLLLMPEGPLRSERSGLDILLEVLLLAYPTVGALIASRRPENPIGWIFCAAGFVFVFQLFSETYANYALYTRSGSLPGVGFMAWISHWVAFPTVLLAAVLLFLLFPDGRLPSRRWWLVAWVAAVGSVLFSLGAALAPGELASYPSVVNPFGIGGVIGGVVPAYRFFEALSNIGLLLCLLSLIVSVISPILRLRRARGEQRQQLKWFVYAATLTVIGFSGIFLSLMGLYFNSGLVNTIVWYMGPLALTLLPVSAGIAILRYRLYDIDIIINRTLLYGALSACVVMLYVLVVGGASTLFQVRGNVLVSLLAVGLVAVVFQPLRSRLQRGVNRLVYGERDEPYAVLSRLGQRLEATLAPEEALSTIVETVAQALKLPYAAITLKQNGKFVTAAEHGSRVGEFVIVPLVYHAEEVGQLVVTQRIPGETFASADRRLLDDLAHQAGAAAHAARLTADLRRSRERLVTAREEERRRLRRDLHDGVGPQLAALMLELETAGDLVSGHPEASALMAKLSERARETVSDVRRSVHALRPPALDELGLVGALREGATRYSRRGLLVSVEAPEKLPPLPAAVEVACYRIVQEALTNVVRHAGASNCRVRIGLDDEALSVEVEDDGRGIREDDSAGVGMSSMRERAEELGGRCSVGLSAETGTLVSAILPRRTANGNDLGEE